MKKVVAIYHKDCNDGTTAAAVVLKKFPEAEVFPLLHNYTNEDLKPILEKIDEETEIYTVDCVMGVKEILNKRFKITSLDHHIGAKEEFEKLAKENPNFTFIFDNEKSGAGVTWSYFFPNEEMPMFVKLVQDADIWTGKFGRDSRDLGNYISGQRNNPVVFLKFLNSDVNELIEKGRSITDFIAEEIKVELKKSHIILKIGEFEVPAYNTSSIFRSEVGHHFSEILNKAVGIFTINGNEVKMSFRSNEGQTPSALDLAKILGGGGHTKASAVFVPLDKFLDMIVR